MPVALRTLLLALFSALLFAPVVSAVDICIAHGITRATNITLAKEPVIGEPLATRDTGNALIAKGISTYSFDTNFLSGVYLATRDVLAPAKARLTFFTYAMAGRFPQPEHNILFKNFSAGSTSRIRQDFVKLRKLNDAARLTPGSWELHHAINACTSYLGSGAGRKIMLLTIRETYDVRNIKADNLAAARQAAAQGIELWVISSPHDLEQANSIACAGPAGGAAAGQKEAKQKEAPAEDGRWKRFGRRIAKEAREAAGQVRDQARGGRNCPRVHKVNHSDSNGLLTDIPDLFRRMIG